MANPIETEFPAGDLWRSLSYFNLYRLLLAASFIFLSLLFGHELLLGAQNWKLFNYASTVYAAVVLASFIPLRMHWPVYIWQLAWLTGCDIVGLTVLAHASGGIQSSIGLLLLVSLAAAGMTSRGKITLFFAALASIAALLEHSYAVLYNDASATRFLQVGLLCVSYFVIAWLAHTLAKYAVNSQQLAQRRGHDLANLVEANFLVMRDMQDGVLVVDEQGVIVQMNPSAERMLRCAVMAGKALSDALPILFGQYAIWKQTGQVSDDIMQLGAGVQVRLRFVAIERDAAHGTVIFLEDMQRVQAEARQIKLAALGRLTANIAHEVRNPLSAISYAAELLREDVTEQAAQNPRSQAAVSERERRVNHPQDAAASFGSATRMLERRARMRGRRASDRVRSTALMNGEGGDATQLRLVDIVLDNTRRINRIVQDVMQLNRRDRAQPEVLELDDVLHDFIDEFNLAERLDDGVLNVFGIIGCRVGFDRGHLRQVLWNLCGNALRYGSRLPGSLQLNVSRIDERVTLSVQDDGPGIPAEQQGKLFEPFFTTASDGTGLGLYIAKELCDANGARLEYHTEAAQAGACFRITFGGLEDGGTEH